MQHILGSYAVSLPTRMIIQQKNGDNRFDLADIEGARLAVFDDVPEGKLADDVIKQLTGEGFIRAERKFRNSAQFKSSAKLTLTSNKQLSISDTGNSMRRRLKIIPFGFIPKVPDPQIFERLAAEAPFILYGLIREAGFCLNNPGKAAFPKCPLIDEASDEYLTGQDRVRLFLDDKTEKGDWTSAAEVYTVYKDWCANEGYRPLNTTRFGLELKRLGIEKKRTADSKGYKGIVLKKQ